MPKFPLNDWLVESARITAFTSTELARPEERQWWKSVVGTEPESRVSRPRSGALEEASSFEAPELRGSRLVLSSEPRRADWRMMPHEPNLTSTPDHIGTMPDAPRALMELGKKWFAGPSAPSIKRLAFGLVVVHPESNREEGYRRLAFYLPHLEIDPVNSSDLFYQINRPRKSASMDKLVVNRLSKWSVGYTTLIQVVPPEQAPGVKSFLDHLELDINTAADRTEPLPGPILSPLLDELYALAMEVAREGDIP